MSAHTPPPFPAFTRAFAFIGLTSFGGPAGQIALMHKEIVEDRGWIAEDEYLHALNFCHLLPGPEAQQLATYIGWKLHGIRGALTAGLLFVIPGALVMLALSIFYAYAANLSWFSALFLGIKAAVLAIVLQAMIRIAGKALGTRFKQGLALAAFVGLFFLNIPFPVIILSAGLLGWIISLNRPKWLALAPVNTPPPPAQLGLAAQTVKTVAIWIAIWAAPMLLIIATLGSDHILWKIGLFFSQLAVVTFGGAYAVLAYMAQAAVQGFGWLAPSEMADGLGLAETTPGPLIMVTQFVGYLAAFRTPEPFSPLVAGFLGAALTTWVTFAPCFLWILAFAPWIERLQHSVPLRGSLAAITAAVVGVIANLALWFALHVLFRTVTDVPGSLPSPALSGLDWRATSLAALCAFLIFKMRWSVFRVLAVSAAVGLILGQV